MLSGRWQFFLWSLSFFRVSALFVLCDHLVKIPHYKKACRVTLRSNRLDRGVTEPIFLAQLLDHHTCFLLLKKPMICSSENRFFKFILLLKNQHPQL